MPGEQAEPNIMYGPTFTDHSNSNKRITWTITSTPELKTVECSPITSKWNVPEPKRRELNRPEQLHSGSALE